MAQTTLTIPTTTLPTGQTTFGPFPLTSPTEATLNVDRTVTGGLDSLQPTDSLTVNVQGSPDGTNWTLIVGSVWNGGVILNSKGVHVTTVSENASCDPSQFSSVRAVMTASTAVAVGGTVVVTTG